MGEKDSFHKNRNILRSYFQDSSELLRGGSLKRCTYEVDRDIKKGGKGGGANEGIVYERTIKEMILKKKQEGREELGKGGN